MKAFPMFGSFYAISACKAENREYCAINLSNNYINRAHTLYFVILLQAP